MSLQKKKRLVIPKITNAAKGEVCCAQFPGCTGGPDDVCFRHFNESWANKGLQIKADDYAGFFGCQHCEDVYSRITYNQDFEDDRHFYMIRAQNRTLRRLFDTVYNENSDEYSVF